MIDLYTWTTPNGRKISIMLEELELPYNAIAVDIGQGEQHDPEFLKISPNNKIPAIVDHDTGLSLMESGAILMYLAEKTGKFMPSSGTARWQVIEWLMMQMGSVGPMLGQTQGVTLVGRVVSAESQLAIANLVVEVAGLGIRSDSDGEGVFKERDAVLPRESRKPPGR